ncbi:MAG: response regulator [Proteobacteria bacterium]|nr:MAG: response regulator [Pseudomonadota bacterium]
MPRILIADDSDTIRLDLKEILEKGGHIVEDAIDGNHGVEIANNASHFDLVISDYNMPGLDGLAMIGKIKAMDKYAATPCAMLTTESSKELKEAGKNAGVIVWVVKPFDPEKLLQTVAKIFEKYPPKA